jgi:histidinol-phosphate phosphatase family protein
MIPPSPAPSFDVVVPTVGRESLRALLAALSVASGPRPGRVFVVDDRPERRWRPLELPDSLDLPIQITRSFGAGPAAARNTGWSNSDAEWVAFLDDDTLPAGDWFDALATDLSLLAPDVGGSQGMLHVPGIEGARPTDWERSVAQLETAVWITADMAYRRSVLVSTGGFDERFPRAYREDADLALQVRARGFRIVQGRRSVEHPVAASSPLVSVQKQSGNADDALMRRRYGRSWRREARAPRGRLGTHSAAVACGMLAVGAAAARRPRVAAVCAGAWAGLVAELFWARVRGGPRTRAEIVTMAVTSVMIPPAAVFHRLRGELGLVRVARRGFPPNMRADRRTRPRAVLFDRDGTLVHDVPYNGDPDAVTLVDGAQRAVARLNAAGVHVAVVTNQSGIGRGLLTLEQVRAVNRRVGEVVGHIDHFQVCPHDRDDGCSCRKPAPGLVVRAAARLRVAPQQCVVIGDTEADVAAGRAAGARAILVPNATTRTVEVDRAPEVAVDLDTAVELLVGT